MAEITRVTIPIDIGRIVRLRSGGPFMTVHAHNKNDGVYSCSWFWCGRYQKTKVFRHEIELVDDEDMKAARELRAGARAAREGKAVTDNRRLKS